MSKYSKYTDGQKEAIFNILGGEEKLDALLCGDLTVEFKQAVKLFFDKNGRVIPRHLKTVVCDPDNNFYLEKPEIDFAVTVNNWEIAFEQKFPISLDELNERTRRIIEPIQMDVQLKNAFRGSWVVTLVPKTEVSDYGAFLESTFLPAAEKGYKNAYPDRTFVNYKKGNLGNQVKVVSGTRHEKLLKAMTKGNVVLVHFINPTQGFSVHAQREVMQYLPDDFLLSGPIDRLTVAANYPTIIARDFNTPGLDCSAVSWRSPGQSLYLGASVGRLRFDFRASLGGAGGFFSGGLSVLG